jgi:hypothetical protein
MRSRLTVFSVLVALSAGAAGAQPSPIDGQLFAFPGSLEEPASATSAGLGQADQWLGDEPFCNPAAPTMQRVVLSPTMYRVNRQDLRAANRNYDDQPLFLDFAGGRVALPAVPIWLYGYQPALRSEDYAFSRGTGADPNAPPASLNGRADTRETRAGLATSGGLGKLRAGVAVEWTRRTDEYTTIEQSGAPERGQRQVNFEGDAFGGTLGLRYDSADSGAGRVTLGLGARYVPALEVTGDQVLDLASGLTVASVSAEREAGWEGGVSARYFWTPAFATLASVGGRTEQTWDGFGITSGQVLAWRLAIHFHDSRDPWTVRFGLGQDQQDGAPEPRAGVFGLGFGWQFEGAVVDIGLLHRSIERGAAPTSQEDRVIGSVGVDF